MRKLGITYGQIYEIIFKAKLGEIVKESNKVLSLRSLKLELFQRIKKQNKTKTGNHTHYIRNRSHYKYILIFPMYDFSAQPSETYMIRI